MNEAVTAVPNAARVWKAGALAAVLASIVNVLIYLIADGLIEGQIAVPRLPDLGSEVEQLPIVAVIAFTAVPILLGTVAFQLAARFSRAYAAAVLAIGVVVMLLSLWPPSPSTSKAQRSSPWCRCTWWPAPRLSGSSRHTFEARARTPPRAPRNGNGEG